MTDLGAIAKVALLGIASSCAGCFGGDSLNCEDPAFYGYSTSVPPVRVPDGLNVPDETGALQIPQGDNYVVRDVETMTECLESPPDFFGEDEEPESNDRVPQ